MTGACRVKEIFQNKTGLMNIDMIGACQVKVKYLIQRRV